MKIQTVAPNVGNFVKSLRDIGYTLEVAIADILDNSISANATHIQIEATPKPDLLFCVLDNGKGMSEENLIEAMRLSARNPDEIRSNKDLGRFGLGLKTASFSQCKRLSVISKQNDKISLKQWDLDYISQENNWSLKTPALEDFDSIPLLDKLKKSAHGTLVIWQEIDRYDHTTFTENIEKTSKHLSFVFHQFLEDDFNRLKITFNNAELIPFNPFNVKHSATQQKPEENVTIKGEKIKITPYILPHHSKVSQQEWEQYATEDGYIKSQGFYLYRSRRLVIYGTWWGMHKASDAHKLVRVKIEIPNTQDKFWGIDIKKSLAKPNGDIKESLKIIINKSTEIGSRPYTGRGRKISDTSTIKLWHIIPENNQEFRFGLNKEHPLYQTIKNSLNKNDFNILDKYLKAIEAYIPLEAIQAQLQQKPHEIKQKAAFSFEDAQALAIKLKEIGLENDMIATLLKTDIFHNHQELLK